MSKKEEIQEIERIKHSLEYHFQKYNEYQIKSKNSSRKKDRLQANDDSFTHAKIIERELENPLVWDAINDGNQYQFEDFSRYVTSDLPDYLEKIETLLTNLKSEKEES